jgi:hypothetical protein
MAYHETSLRNDAGYMRPHGQPPQRDGAGYMRPDGHSPRRSGAGWMDPESMRAALMLPRLVPAATALPGRDAALKKAA